MTSAHFEFHSPVDTFRLKRRQGGRGKQARKEERKVEKQKRQGLKTHSKEDRKGELTDRERNKNEVN
jgi:hypothetical protein